MTAPSSRPPGALTTYPAGSTRELPFGLPAGAIIEGYCVDPLDGVPYPYGSSSEGVFWIADQWAWAGWLTREARDRVLLLYRGRA